MAYFVSCLAIASLAPMPGPALRGGALDPQRDFNEWRLWPICEVSNLMIAMDLWYPAGVGRSYVDAADLSALAVLSLLCRF
jgi:hypothetical protein